MKFVRVTQKLRPTYQKGVAALEAIATYPLGSDFFKIDHGADYFAFFDRLGRLEYRAAVAGDDVVAVGAGILRRVPFRQGGPLARTWYLCDLKVHPLHRGSRIPLKMLGSAFLWNYLKCPRGYAITMNPGDGSPNRVVRLLKNFRWAPVRFAVNLEIFSLDHAQMTQAAPLVEKHRGPLKFLALSGIKDIVLQSTGKAMPLTHVQFGPSGTHGVTAPLPGYVHMLCAPEGDALAQDLRATGLRPNATASVVHHRMENCDWRFVLTSEI